MNTWSHDGYLLGAYVLGALDPAERQTVENHLSACHVCQAELAGLQSARDALSLVPHEALMEGPPPGSGRVLQRTLRAAHLERTARAPRRSLFALAASVVAVATALGTGVLIGRSVAPQTFVRPPSPISAAPTLPAGTRIGQVDDPITKVKLIATVVPANGWVRVNAVVTGVPVGQNCRLLVIRRDGTHEIAGGWIATDKGVNEGTSLDGSAAVSPADVAGIQIQNTFGHTFATVTL